MTACRRGRSGARRPRAVKVKSARPPSSTATMPPRRARSGPAARSPGDRQNAAACYRADPEDPALGPAGAARSRAACAIRAGLAPFARGSKKAIEFRSNLFIDRQPGNAALAWRSPPHDLAPLAHAGTQSRQSSQKAPQAVRVRGVGDPDRRAPPPRGYASPARCCARSRSPAAGRPPGVEPRAQSRVIYLNPRRRARFLRPGNNAIRGARCRLRRRRADPEIAGWDVDRDTWSPTVAVARRGSATLRST